MTVSGRGGGVCVCGGRLIVQPLPSSYHCSMAKVNSHFLLFFFFFFPGISTRAAGHVSGDRNLFDK